MSHPKPTKQFRDLIAIGTKRLELTGFVNQAIATPVGRAMNPRENAAEARQMEGLKREAGALARLLEARWEAIGSWVREVLKQHIEMVDDMPDEELIATAIASGFSVMENRPPDPKERCEYLVLVRNGQMIAGLELAI